MQRKARLDRRISGESRCCSFGQRSIACLCLLDSTGLLSDPRFPTRKRLMIGERRQHARLVPSSPMFVSLDASKSGLLLDVCPGGVAVASLIPRNLEDVIALEFDLPEGCGHVAANAAVTWTRDSGHLSGARFLDLDEYSRQQLSKWIQATTSAAVVET